MSGAKCLVATKALTRLDRRTRSSTETSISSTGWLPDIHPALLISPSTRPQALSISAAALDHRGLVADVGFKGEGRRRSRGLGDLVHHDLRARRVPGQDAHMWPLGGQPEGERAPDALRCPGDDDDLALDVDVHLVTSLLWESGTRPA